MTNSRLQINLSGPQGNAFVLLGYAQQLIKDYNLDLESTKVYEEMTSGDYDKLLKVFRKYFEDYVDLY